MSPTTAARARQADRALQQRHDALDAANRTRLGRAWLRREMRAGRITFAELAARRPEPLRDTPLFELVGQLPGVGQRRVERLNRRAIAARVNLARTLGEASTATLRWLQTELDGAEPEGADVDKSVRPMGGVSDWRALALALDRLIRDHERSVRDESLPTERWAWADERLHTARAELMRSHP